MASHDLLAVNHTRSTKPASLPSPSPTPSFWTSSSPDANPLAREGSTGPLTTDADICIIGSGITGVGVAYHLSEATEKNLVQSPLRVVILEARDFCGGATGRNGGHLTPAAFLEFYDRMTKYGPEEAKRSYAFEARVASSLVDIIRDHGWEDDVDLVNGGHIHLFTSDQEIELAQRDRKAAIDADWSPDGILELSKEYVEATYGAHHSGFKAHGHNLWPVKLVTKLYHLAKSRTTSMRFDLALHTHTPVTAIEIGDATGMYQLSTPRGVITCSRVVHATNGYASHLLPFLAGPQGIVPVRGQVIATRASVGSDQIKTSSWVANEHPTQGWEYWFPRPVKTANDAPLIILGGGRNAACPNLEVYVDDDSTCHPSVGAVLRAFLPAMFEGKFEPGREPEMEWTGITGYTAIDDPFVGPVDKLPLAQGTVFARYTGQYIAAGYTGHGMPRAFGCAEVVAQMIVAELEGATWTQPDWLPTRYLTWEERAGKTGMHS